MMLFEFSAHNGFNFAEGFARHFGLKTENNQLIIPPHMGQGKIRVIELDPDIQLTIHHYSFHEEFVLRRRSLPESEGSLNLVFFNTGIPNHYLSNGQSGFFCTKVQEPAVEISSSDLHSEIRYPPGYFVDFIVISMKACSLVEMLDPDTTSNILNTIIKCRSSFLFHERMWPEVEQITRRLSLMEDRRNLGQLYFKSKVLELLYLIFDNLLSRVDEPQRVINGDDGTQLYHLRSLILSDLSVPPRLSELAEEIGMSETKMKQLFKQVFGDTIYNYYQKARMEEAAFQLKQSGQTVADIGYGLGFTNLSHFSRMFQRYYQTSPKKYQSVG